MKYHLIGGIGCKDGAEGVVWWLWIWLVTFDAVESGSL